MNADHGADVVAELLHSRRVAAARTAIDLENAHECVDTDGDSTDSEVFFNLGASLCLVPCLIDEGLKAVADVLDNEVIVYCVGEELGKVHLPCHRQLDSLLRQVVELLVQVVDLGC